MRKGLDDHKRSGRRLNLADQLMVACDREGRFVHTNFATRRIIRQLSAASPESLLPSEHRGLLARCVESGKRLGDAAVVDGVCFHWTYRRLVRRAYVLIEGRCLGARGADLWSGAALLRQLLGQFAFGLLMVDQDLNIRYANPSGAALLENAWPGAIQADRLCECTIVARRELETLVRRQAGAVILHRRSGQAPLEILATRIRDESMGAASDDRLMVLCVVDPDYSPPSFPERLRDLYGVTPAEAKVASVLRRGARLEAGAEQLGVGHQTIRTHVRSSARSWARNARRSCCGG